MEVLLNKHVGDITWLMYDNQVVCGTIKRILYRQFISNLDYESIVTVEKYVVVVKDHKYEGGVKEVKCDKNDLFPDKESLIKSL